MKKQSGFTLIELIMVIVILGILSAFALPRFADLGGDARVSTLNAGVGAVRSAAAIVHSQALAEGGTGTTVTLEDGSVVNLDVAGGYPAALPPATGPNISIVGVAQLSADFTTDTSALSANGDVEIRLNNSATCSFEYDESAGTVVDIQVGGC